MMMKLLILMLVLSILEPTGTRASGSCLKHVAGMSDSSSAYISELNRLLKKVNRRKIVIDNEKFAFSELTFERWLERDGDFYVLRMKSPQGKEVAYIVINRVGPTQINGDFAGVYVDLMNRGKGLGKLLYLVGAHDLYLKTGLVMEKSGHTSRDANLVWRALLKSGFVELNNSKLLFKEDFLNNELVEDWFKSNLIDILDESQS